MPEQEQEVVENKGAAANVAAESRADQVPAGKPKDDAADNTPFLMSFKSREEAEKGYKELQARATRAEQERSITAAKLEVLERMSKPGYEEQTGEAQKAFDSQVMDQLDANPRTALKLIRDAGNEVLSLTRKELAQLKAEILEQIEQRDPEAQAHKADIERCMEKYHMTRAQAKEFVLGELVPARAAASKGVKQPERSQLPGGKRQTGAAQNDDDVDDVEIPPAVLAQLNAMPLSDEDKKEILANTKKELARKGK
jgi:hypothetical protein